MSEKSYGQVAYEALRAGTGRGNPWEHLLPSQQNTWHTIAQAVADEMTRRGLQTAPTVHEEP